MQRMLEGILQRMRGGENLCEIQKMPGNLCSPVEGWQKCASAYGSCMTEVCVSLLQLYDRL